MKKIGHKKKNSKIKKKRKKLKIKLKKKNIRKKENIEVSISDDFPKIIMVQDSLHLTLDKKGRRAF